MKYVKRIIFLLVFVVIVYIAVFFFVSSREEENDFIFREPYIVWLALGSKDFFYDRDIFFDDNFEDSSLQMNLLNGSSNYSIVKRSGGKLLGRRTFNASKDSSLLITDIENTWQMVEKEYFSRNLLLKKIFELKKDSTSFGIVVYNYQYKDKILLKKHCHFFNRELKDSLLIAAYEFDYDSTGSIKEIRTKISDILNYVDGYVSLMKRGSEILNHKYKETRVTVEEGGSPFRKIVKIDDGGMNKSFIVNHGDNHIEIDSYRKDGKKLAKMIIKNEKGISKFLIQDGRKKYQKKIFFEDNGDTSRVELLCDSYFDSEFHRTIVYAKGKVKNDSMRVEGKFLPGIRFDRWNIYKEWSYNPSNQLQTFNYFETKTEKAVPLLEMHKKISIEYDENSIPRKWSSFYQGDFSTGEVKNSVIYSMEEWVPRCPVRCPF